MLLLANSIHSGIQYYMLFQFRSHDLATLDVGIKGTLLVIFLTATMHQEKRYLLH